MLKTFYLILLVLAAPLVAYADPARPEPAPAGPVAAKQSDVPATAAARSEPVRNKGRGETPVADGQHATGAIARLRNFLANVRTVQADFTQAVLDKNGKRTQATSGVMHFSRPGKFRWNYLVPYEQIIVGDGERFWLYDVDLNQVTVKRLDAALGSSPAALLAGGHEIERDFELKNIECKPIAISAQRAASGVAGESVPSCEDALEWLEAKPKAHESSFERIRMAFNAQSDLMVMELSDTFGHTTVLRFSNVQHNPRLPAVLFKFEPPKGADVLEGE